MKIRSLAIASLCSFALACAAAKPKGEEPQTTIKEVRTEVTYQNYFDLANCFPRAPDFPPGNPTESVLYAYIVSGRAQAMECLVHPNNRGPADATNFTVKATVAEGGTPEFVATGDNLTEAGAACIAEAFKKLPKFPNVGKGTGTLTSEAQFKHTVQDNPAVRLNVSEGEDVLARLRLEQPKWCDCYAEYKDKAPPELTAAIAIYLEAPKDPADPTRTLPNPDITFANVTPEAQSIASCLEKKMEAVPQTITSNELKIPAYRVTLIHSGADDVNPSTPPDVQWVQYESIRARGAADIAVAEGIAKVANERFNAGVANYQKLGAQEKTTKDPSALAIKMDKQLKQLGSLCNTMLRADDTQARALEKQLAFNKKVAAFYAAQIAAKPTETHWADANKRLSARIAEEEKAVGATVDRRKQHEKSCAPLKPYMTMASTRSEEDAAPAPAPAPAAKPASKKPSPKKK